MLEIDDHGHFPSANTIFDERTSDGRTKITLEQACQTQGRASDNAQASIKFSRMPAIFADLF
jgi:hypothetical protein